MGRLWRSGRSRRAALVLGIAAVAMIGIAGTVLADPGGMFGGSDNPWPYESPTDHAPVLAAVGDISCQPGSPEESEKPTDVCDQGSGSTERNAAQTATADQVEGMHPGLVAVTTSSMTTTVRTASAGWAISTTTTATSTTPLTGQSRTPR